MGITAENAKHAKLDRKSMKTITAKYAKYSKLRVVVFFRVFRIFRGLNPLVFFVPFCAFSWPKPAFLVCNLTSPLRSFVSAFPLSRFSLFP